MPRLERSVDKHGFPIPPQIDDLPGRNAPRDTEQFGNVSFAGGKRELSEAGQRWKKRIIWLGIIGIVVGLLLSSVSKPFWEMYADMRTRMGTSAMLEGDYETARGHFDAALSADPDQSVARFRRGLVLYELKELDAANEDLTKTIDANNPEMKLRALLLRSQIHYRQNRGAEAMRDADDVVRISRNDAYARNQRAYLCALLGQDLKKGLADIDAALQVDPKNAAYLDTRGYLLFKQGDYEAALADLNLAIMGMEERHRHLLLQQRRTQHGRESNVEAKLKEARENLGVTYYHRGEVYEALKRSEDAASEKARGIKFGYNPEEGVY